ncbi:unnamed protein product [Paramecium pentaurelia]|uniref:Uncharacterized protein n=1 Tax=Paramecium pentaurelia TaxID=43138 RepID=A0A8S1T6H0_9CILI|nr:unnamed protein product [Paramecium pentaurelia]
MGWWNGNNDEDDANKNFSSNVNSTFKSSTTTRQCRPDPQDQNFMICKNIVKESSTINGQRNDETKEYEERIPISQNYTRRNQHYNQNNPEFDFNQMDEEIGQMFENFTNNFFKNFPSVVFGPMRVDFQNPNYETRTNNNYTNQQRPQQQQSFQSQPKIQKKKDDIYDC